MLYLVSTPLSSEFIREDNAVGEFWALPDFRYSPAVVSKKSVVKLWLQWVSDINNENL